MKKNSVLLFAAAASALLAAEAFAQPATVRFDAGISYAPGPYFD